MSLMLTCSQVTGHLTEYGEGTLPWLLRGRMALHLSMCPGCKAFLAALRRVPRLVQAVFPPPPEAPPEALAALQGALARLQQPRFRVPGTVAERLAGPEPNPLLARLARAQADLAAGRAPTAPFLAPGLLEGFPDTATWRWWTRGLGGARMTRLLASPPHGELYLLQMPPGRRFPRHAHRGAESLLVLHGGLDDGARQGGPGDWFHYEAQHPDHAPAAGEDGCWALIWAEPEAVRLAGWRGWIQGALS